MNRFAYRKICALLVLVALFCCGLGASADAQIDSALSDTAAYVCNTVKNPQVGSVGGEWAVLGLARSGCSVPDGYIERYCAAAEEYVAACGGVLHTRKYTEYSRVILALTAVGRDPTDVAGYNLLTALGDYDKTVWQGINGPIWALLALDCGGYDVPYNQNAKTQATRELYLNDILSRQLSDGGFSLTGEGSADPGITAMALQALAGYTGRGEVDKAVERAVGCLSALQDDSGGVGDCESCAQAIIALCRLGISLGDPRFVKGGNSLLNNLLSFRVGGGGFMHSRGDGAANQMATEQALLALTALSRARSGQSGLYDMIYTAQQSGDVWRGAAAGRCLTLYYRKDAPAWEGLGP